ncbi:MAG: ankyrin repeat domain-containing protein [Bernardetiaceae bacterium]|jgi:ankyrin repeat protein|nr:ankyrin repeat domain-containing protein [Bernardetiaceae bacterium]
MIFYLISQGDAATVEHLLNDQPELVYARRADGLSATLWAAYQRRPELTALFAVRNLNPDIFEAAAVGNVPVTELLLSQQPRLATEINVDGFSALGLACFFGHLNVARLLVVFGADVNQPSVNPLQVAPLHSAVAHGSYDLVDFLLQHDADPDQPQQQGLTALHAAAAHGRADLAQLLLNYGANPAPQNDQGQTPADLARQNQHLELAQQLGG